jgi:NTE family protein
VAYIGALKAFEEKEILQNITRVGGTSAGAINALLLALGFDVSKAKEVLYDLDFRTLMDNSGWFVPEASRVFTEYGWNKGDVFKNWVGELIKEKTGSSKTTFGQMKAMCETKKFKELYVLGTNLSTHFSEVFSHEKTPEMPIAQAVRISMSIPIFFASRKSARGDVYVDGGVLANYPVKLFDRERYVVAKKMNTPYYDAHNEQLRAQKIEISPYVYNKETLGFRLDSSEEIGIFRDQKEPVHHEVKNFTGYMLGLVQSILDQQLNTHMHSDDWQRTVYIDASAAKTTEFDLSKEKKDLLVKAGEEGVKKYFAWYDNNPAVNK